MSRRHDDGTQRFLVHRFRRTDAFHADDFGHHFLEDRRSDLGTVIDALRVIDDDEDQELRVFQGPKPMKEPTYWPSA